MDPENRSMYRPISNQSLSSGEKSTQINNYEQQAVTELWTGCDANTGGALNSFEEGQSKLSREADIVLMLSLALKNL